MGFFRRGLPLHVIFFTCLVTIVCNCHLVLASETNQDSVILQDKNESVDKSVDKSVDEIVTEAVEGSDDKSTHQSKGKSEALPVEQGNFLLRPRVGKLIYEYDIYTFHKSGRLYLSLVDMIDVLELSVLFDEQTGKGQGWFLREDWDFSIDLQNKQVVSKGQPYQFTDDDMVIDGGELFLAEDKLSEWFDMEFQADISQQYLEIASPYPLPGVARYYRAKKKKAGYGYVNKAVLPRQKVEYDWLDINTANIRLGARHRRYDDVRPNSFFSGTMALEGQALKHQAYTLVNADSRNNLTNIIARLSMRDEEAVLLGPLKARSYSIGDTNVTDLPLTGDSRQELGFHVSNSPLDNVQFQVTDINGDAIPGWDVELYRNGVLLDSIVIGDDGYYEFADVQLFGGNNEFELFFYGPQGEIRKRDINVPVTSALLAAQNGTYDVSVSLSDTKTFQKNKTDDVDRETPHFVARYNKSIGDSLGYIGVRNRDINGDNKTLVGAGVTSLVRNTIIDAGVAVDEEANAAAQLNLRKNIDNWNISLNGAVQDEDYIVSDTSTPKILSLSGYVQKSFMPSFATRTNVSAGMEYSKTGNGLSQTSGRLGASYQKGRLNFSNSIFFDKSDLLEGGSYNQIKDTLSVRANMGKYFIRAGVDYDIKPVQQVDRYFSQINYYPSPSLSGDIRIDHEPDRDFSELRMGVNYTNDYFRTSPFVEIDNQNEILAGLNLNFNVIDSPNEAKPVITSTRSIGRGLVSSFVFYDKNGNNVFDGDDEPLPDVIVESVNVKRRAETDEKGYSLIRDLSTARATDIQVDKQSLPDPYMIPANQGVSIFASAGEIVELDFPIHLSGEIDGTISVRDEKGEVKPSKRADLVLYPIQSEKTDETKVRAAFDGFYVASQIPPGQYMMTVSNDTAKREKASLPPPRFVTIGYDGDIIYGSNFELHKGQANVPIDVVYNENLSSTILYGLKTRPQPKTKLLSLFHELNTRNSDGQLYDGLEELKTGEDGEKIYKLSSNDLEESHKKCRELVENAVPCVLQVYIPTEMKPIQTASRSLK